MPSLPDNCGTGYNLDIMDLPEKAISMIALHQAQPEVGKTALEGYQR